MQCLGGSPGHCTSQHRPAPALHMLSFENFVKAMLPSLSELKVKPSFCFAFKIPDNVTASNLNQRGLCPPNNNGTLGFSDLPMALNKGLGTEYCAKVLIYIPRFHEWHDIGENEQWLVSKKALDSVCTKYNLHIRVTVSLRLFDKFVKEGTKNTTTA